MEAFVSRSSMDPPITTKRPRSARDWGDHQETITRLYSRDGSKLSEVMEVMEKEYGFYATYVGFFSLLRGLTSLLVRFTKTSKVLMSSQGTPIQEKNIRLGPEQKC